MGEIRLLTCAVEPEPGTVARGSLSGDAFRGPVTRWTPADVEAVELAVPEAVTQVIASGKPEEGWRGAHHHMTPARWEQSAEPARLPSLWCLEGAHVYGGANKSRWGDPAVAFDGWHRTGQLVLTANHELLPASYAAIDGNRTLPADLVQARDGELLLTEPGEPRYLEGTYVLLGNVQSHFGHMVLEGLSRAWAAEYLHPDLLVTWLVYEDHISPFAAQLLKLADLPVRIVERASPHDIVERLVVPDLAMRSHRWITTAQATAWDRVARPARPTAQVYLSRRDVTRRRCVNEDRVEALFAGAGWEIVRPEQLKIREQIALAGRARRIAGCSGSQMYLTAFQPDGGDNILIAPRNFLLRDDLLIGSLRSHRTAVVLGSAVDFDSEARSWEADLEAVQAALGPPRRVRTAVGRLIDRRVRMSSSRPRRR